MKLTKFSLALLLLLPASMAVSQTFDPPGMRAGVSMLESHVQAAFNQYGINADPATLTLAQLSEIINVLNAPDKDSGGVSAKALIEAALRRN